MPAISPVAEQQIDGAHGDVPREPGSPLAERFLDALPAPDGPENLAELVYPRQCLVLPFAFVSPPEAVDRIPTITVVGVCPAMVRTAFPATSARSSAL
ncbi:hypothetical protein GCM10023259_078300 [Thermocatellispora tengchongensis]